MDSCILTALEQRHGAHPIDDAEIDEVVTCPGYGVVLVSWSEISDARQCAFKRHLNYDLRYTKPQSDSSPAGMGTLWHLVMETHYKTMKHHQMEFVGQHVKYSMPTEDLVTLCKANVSALLDRLEQQGTEAESLRTIRWMYAGHIEMYGIDDEWWVIAVEHTATLPLRNEAGDESWVMLKVKLDLVVKDYKGRKIIVDHKSCGDLPGDIDLELDDQFGLYQMALENMGERIFMTIHSAAKRNQNKGDYIKPGDEGYKASMKAQALPARFKRTLLNRTKPELRAIELEALATAEEAHTRIKHPRNPDPRRCKYLCDKMEACLFGRRSNNNTKTLLMLESQGFVQDFDRH